MDSDSMPTPLFRFAGGHLEQPLRCWQCLHSSCDQLTYVWPYCTTHALQLTRLLIKNSTVGPFLGLFACHPGHSAHEKQLLDEHGLDRIVAFRRGELVALYIGESLNSEQFYARYQLTTREDAHGPYAFDLMHNFMSPREERRVIKEQRRSSKSAGRKRLSTVSATSCSSPSASFSAPESWLDGALWRSYACFVNHPANHDARFANVETINPSPNEEALLTKSHVPGPYLKMYATRDIYDGEELLLWYGDKYFNTSTTSTDSADEEIQHETLWHGWLYAPS